MGVLSTLFSSSKTVSKITDSIISTGDKLFHTDEEKADDRKKQREFFPTLLGAYEPFKIAQRLLAGWFSLLFGLAFLVGLVVTVINMILAFNQKVGEMVHQIDIAPLFSLVSSFGLGTIIVVIVAFYFAGGVINTSRSSKK